MSKYSLAFVRKGRQPPVRLRRILNFIIFLGFFIALINLIYSFVPSETSSQVLHSELRTTPFFVPKHNYQCEKLVNGDFDHVPDGNRNLRRLLMNDREAWSLFGNCSKLLSRHYYPQHPLKNEERDYPLAYVLLVNEHLEQLEILLNSIYAPQNVYCIHVDFKSSYLFHNAVERLSSCFKNVFIPKERIAVVHGGASMLHAQQNCLKELFYGWSKISWKYVLLLQGHDFPLRTNGEIVEILKIHNGANDVELLQTPTERFSRKFKGMLDGHGFAFDFQETKEEKAPPPHNLIIYKGSVATVLNRQTVQFSLENRIAKDLMDWLNDTLMPDELYWSTLNHNEFLQIPGGYPGRCVQTDESYKTWISRFAIWQQYEHLKCNGTWRHSVCMFNSGDLHMLSERPELFLNKIWIHDDSVALDCMHEILYNRTYRRKHLKNPNYLDMSYYKRLSSVMFQEWRLSNPHANSSLFHCVLCRSCSH